MANTNYIVLIQQNSTPDAATPAIAIEAPMPDSFAMDIGATYQQMLPQGFTGNKVVDFVAALSGSRLAIQAFSAQLWAGNTETELSIRLEFHTETDPVADVRTPIVNLMKLCMPSISTSTGFLSSPGPSIDWSQAGQIAKDAGSSIFGSAGNVLSGSASALSSLGSGAINAAKNLFGITPSAASLTDTNTQTTDGANNAVQQAVTQNPQLGAASYWKSRIKNNISIRVGNYMFFDSVVITRVNKTYQSNLDAQTGLPHHVIVEVGFKPLFMLTQEDLDNLYINPNASSTASASNSFSLPAGAITGPTANSFGPSATYGLNL